MIILSFKMSSHWNTRIDQLDLVEATEMSLRYDLFLGDIMFVVHEVNFNCAWGWIPIIDFVVSLLFIIQQLENRHPCAKFEFTESNAYIYFKLKNDLVHIHSNFTKSATTISLIELAIAVREFMKETRDKLLIEYPQLQGNKAFNSLLSLKKDINM